MAKSFTTGKPAINMTIVGFGQGGSRMADEFAAFKDEDGKPIYNCLALNSNTGDLEGLKNIPQLSRISLELGGLGKNPEKAMSILENDVVVKEKLKSFIQDKVREDDDLVLFFAGLGGGTGTSTIVKAIDEFFEHRNKPIIQEEFKKVRSGISAEEYSKNQNAYIKQAFKNAEERFVKIGVIVTLPLRNDGPDVLRQVNDFAQQIWKSANNAGKGIAFVTFADNQHFYDTFNKLPHNMRNGIENYRDYGNKQIADNFHELNTATKVGGASVVLDKEDFRRVIMENTGSLVFSKQEVPIVNIRTSDSIVELFKKTLETSSLHAPISLVRKEGEKLISKRVHHIGILSILDGTKDFGGGAYLDVVIEQLHQKLPITGAVFNGYVNTRNDNKATTHIFYKVDGLPERLEKGLVTEYQEFMEINNKFEQEKTTIQSINVETEDELGFDLGELGLADLVEVMAPVEEETNVDPISSEEEMNDAIAKMMENQFN